MFRRSKKQPSEQQPRRLRRGLLTAAFAAVTLTSVGIGADYLQGVPDPYTNPRAAEIYNIPTAACAAAIQNHIATVPTAQAHVAEPVLIIPGFATNDAYMSSLHQAIGAVGHTTYGWDQGFNIGIDAQQAAALGQRLQRIYEDHGRQKISIVGYSLGGIYARELARLYPDMVESVITLGSPFGMQDARLSETYRAFHGNTPADTNIHAALLEPPPVPTTSLYALADDIVPWENSLNPAAPQAENLPIQPGHLRMPFDAAVARVIIDRLAEPAQGWRPITAKVCAPRP
jgi:pimeloyl-ACP methyl ester carboxylesterase